jgi:multidrug efflux pump subunit AcrA (membrane-fusion protein)
VVQKGSQSSVYLVNNNKVEERKVQLGMRTPSEVEIKQGLKPSDRVIVTGTTYVRPGDKVQVQPALKE